MTRAKNIAVALFSSLLIILGAGLAGYGISENKLGTRLETCEKTSAAIKDKYVVGNRAYAFIGAGSVLAILGVGLLLFYGTSCPACPECKTVTKKSETAGEF